MTPTIAGTEDCQATVAASCRWVKPRVLSTARSRRRRRTEAIRVSPSAPMAPAARMAASAEGVEPAEW